MQQDFRAQAQANRDSIERMRKGMERLEHRIMGAARKSAQKERKLSMAPAVRCSTAAKPPWA